MKIANGLIGLAATALWAGSAGAADLSPGHWPATQRADLQQLEFFGQPPTTGPVDGATILVTGIGSPVAVHAGAEALRQGGTAADAAATVALTQIATDLGAVISYAGAMELIYFDAKTGKVSVLDGNWNSYAGETDPASIPESDLSQVSGQPPPPGAGQGDLGRQTLVPGFMAGIEAMQRRFGRLAFADIFQPAIWYADHGVTVTLGEAIWFQQRRAELSRTPGGSAFARMPDGSLPKAGDLFRQPALARTLRAVASQGADYMYKGDWARAYVAAVRAAGGKATTDDLASYRATWHDPVSVPFAGAQVFGVGETQGACSVLLGLNLLSASGIEARGAYWRDPKALETYLRVLKFGYEKSITPQPLPPERAAGLGATSCQDWLSPAYAAAVAPQLAKPSPAAPPPVAVQDRTPTPHSASVVVVDRWGNVAALVHTINAITWGDTGIVVGGVPIGDSGAIYKYLLKQTRPGDRVPGALAPLIALRGGRPVLAIASVGSSLTAETTRLAATLLGGHEDLASAMTAPPMITNFTTGPTPDDTWAQPTLVPAGAYGGDMLAALKAAGLVVQEVPEGRARAIRGNAVVGVIDQPSGALHAVETPSFSFAESERQVGVPPPQAVSLPAEILDRYVGAYQLGPRTVTRIEREGGRLFSRTGPTGVKAELFAQADDGRFFERDYDVQVAFHLDATGRAEAESVRRNGVEINARRIDLAEAARIDALPPPPIPVRTTPSPAQPAAGVEPVGDWTGDVIPTLPVTFHIRRRPGDGAYAATVDSPNSGAFDVPVVVSVRGEALTLEMPTINARIEATWRAASSQWVGRWTQNGGTSQLTLSRGVLAPLETVAALDGTWDGAGPRGQGPALLLRFRTIAGHGTTGTLDLPDANSRNSYLTHIRRTGDRIAMGVEALGGALEGRLSPDGRTIEGRFTAFGATTPVILTRRPEPQPRS